ncbi:MAG: L-threonine-O-3-phosphate decarboxylase [Sulfurimonas sp.]|nr:MAG: L-threonine-O-3-phosphate decarboxylase [Sulfurimonas sp.]
MKHGANIYKYAKDLNIHAEKIIDFSSNINFYNPKIKTQATNNMLVKYADSTYSDLKNTISLKYKINKNQISLFNGATSAIFELFKHLKEKNVYLYAPLYGEYEKAVKKDKKIYKINRFKDLYKKPKKDSVVVFVNPSTPDGKYYDLKKLFAIWQEQKCTIILDESFIEFEDLKYFRSQIENNKKLYIIQSFSKFYACAGVRIGAIFSHKSNIKNLSIPMWALSSFDVAFLNQRLLDFDFDKKSKKLHKKNKKELFQILKNSKLFDKIYKSDSNFFLTKSEIADKIFSSLLKENILARTCGSFDFLSNNYLRFAVKNKYSHKKLIKALKKIKI